MSSPIEKLKEQIQSYIEARKKANCGKKSVKPRDYADFLRQGDAEFFALAANQSAQMASQLLEAIEILEKLRFIKVNGYDFESQVVAEFLAKLSKGSEK